MMKIKALKEKEQELLREVLTKTQWDLEKASRLLKIPLAQLKRKVREHEMQKPDLP